MESSHYWIRVNVAVEVCLKEAVIDVALNVQNDPSYTGLPANPQELFQTFNNFYKNRNHPLHRVLKPSQWSTLIKPSGQTYLQDCDMTIIISAVQSEDIVRPVGGWKIKCPQAGDRSIGAFIWLARQLRNDVKHCTINDISTQSQFDSYWGRVKEILQGLGYKNMEKFNSLKDNPLDTNTKSIIDVLKNNLNQINQRLDNLNCIDISSKQEVETISSALNNFLKFFCDYLVSFAPQTALL